MKRSFVKPRVLLSSCLQGNLCRWDQLGLDSLLYKKLKPYVKFISVCPEIEIGLGTPRDPIRLVKNKKSKNLYQPATGKNLTKAMNSFSDEFLNSLEKIGGIILKDKSPTCGTKNVKLYDSNSTESKYNISSIGIFAEKCKEKFGYLPITGEVDLSDQFKYEEFLTKLFTVANFQSVITQKTNKPLIEMHARYHLLLSTYSKKNLKEMDLILKIGTIADRQEFYSILYNTLKRKRRIDSTTKILSESFNHFKNDLSNPEKSKLNKFIRDYSTKKIQLKAVLDYIKILSIRYDRAYIRSDMFFTPYPPAL